MLISNAPIKWESSPREQITYAVDLKKHRNSNHLLKENPFAWKTKKKKRVGEFRRALEGDPKKKKKNREKTPHPRTGWGPWSSNEARKYQQGALPHPNHLAPQRGIKIQREKKKQTSVKRVA